MKINDLIINGEAAKTKTISKMIHAFYNPVLLSSCGGYIFTYRRHNNILYIGVKPAIIEGQRSNHFDLDAGPETKVFLTGNINPNGEISLLFKISKINLNEKTKLDLKELYIQFSSLLINHNYKGPGKFEWITKKMIEESALFSPVPMTIYDLINLL